MSNRRDVYVENNGQANTRHIDHFAMRTMRPELRAAFHDAITDPKFLADAKKQQLEVKEVSGEKVAQLIATAYAMPADVVKAANEAMNLTGSSGARAE